MFEPDFLFVMTLQRKFNSEFTVWITLGEVSVMDMYFSDCMYNFSILF